MPHYATLFRRKAVGLLEAIRSATTLLDEGLSIYRHNFLRFLPVTLVCFAPAIIAGILGIDETHWINDEAELNIAALLLSCVLLPYLPLIYMVGSSSRMALAASEACPVRLRAALAIHPLRFAQIIGFSVLYAGFTLPICLILSIVIELLLNVFAFVPFLDLFGFISYFAALLYSPMLIITSAIYAFQPWFQESASLGKTLRRSFVLLGYCFRRNLVTWSLAALLSTVAAALMLMISYILYLQVIFALGVGESWINELETALGYTIRLIFVSLVTPISLAIITAPLPIWMALLYRRNRNAHDGTDLEARIHNWSRERDAPPETSAESSDLRENIIPLTIVET